MKDIDAVYGSRNPVQCCRIHKLRNIIGHQQFWMLKVYLEAIGKEEKLAQTRRAGLALIRSIRRPTFNYGRDNVESDPSRPKYLLTEQGVGYRLKITS